MQINLITEWYKASVFIEYVNLSGKYLTSDLWGEFLSNIFNFSEKAESFDLS